MRWEAGEHFCLVHFQVGVGLTPQKETMLDVFYHSESVRENPAQEL